MSHSGVHRSEMHGDDGLDDAAIEALLTARDGGGELAELAAFVEHLRAVYASGPTPTVGPALASVFAVGLTWPVTRFGAGS